MPLYAVETVRMLLDRGLLAQRRAASTGRPARSTTLEVPETLHALIAARLDGLAPEERQLVQDASVLGKTFTRAALGRRSTERDEDAIARSSPAGAQGGAGVHADPRSPERGQYGFLQALVRHVAYETLSKRERKSRHLAAAGTCSAHSRSADEVAEVLASHYLAAFDAAPDAEMLPRSAPSVREMLARAGERAGSLGAPEEGQRYYAQAAALADDSSIEAELLEQAGRLAHPGESS